MSRAKGRIVNCILMSRRFSLIRHILPNCFLEQHAQLFGIVSILYPDTNQRDFDLFKNVLYKGVSLHPVRTFMRPVVQFNDKYGF